MFRVIKGFYDLRDQGHRYEAGDLYPRAGLSPTDKRILELSTSNNRQRTPLIEKIDDPPKRKRPAKEA